MAWFPRQEKEGVPRFGFGETETRGFAPAPSGRNPFGTQPTSAPAPIQDEEVEGKVHAEETIVKEETGGLVWCCTKCGTPKRSLVGAHLTNKDNVSSQCRSKDCHYKKRNFAEKEVSAAPSPFGATSGGFGASASTPSSANAGFRGSSVSGFSSSPSATTSGTFDFGSATAFSSSSANFGSSSDTNDFSFGSIPALAPGSGFVAPSATKSATPAPFGRNPFGTQPTSAPAPIQDEEVEGKVHVEETIVKEETGSLVWCCTKCGTPKRSLVGAHLTNKDNVSSQCRSKDCHYKKRNFAEKEVSAPSPFGATSGGFGAVSSSTESSSASTKTFGFGSTPATAFSSSSANFGSSSGTNDFSFGSIPALAPGSGFVAPSATKSATPSPFGATSGGFGATSFSAASSSASTNVFGFGSFSMAPKCATHKPHLDNPFAVLHNKHANNPFGTDSVARKKEAALEWLREHWVEQAVIKSIADSVLPEGDNEGRRAVLGDKVVRYSHGSTFPHTVGIVRYVSKKKRELYAPLSPCPFTSRPLPHPTDLWVELEGGVAVMLGLLSSTVFSASEVPMGLLNNVITQCLPIDPASGTGSMLNPFPPPPSGSDPFAKNTHPGRAPFVQVGTVPGFVNDASSPPSTGTYKEGAKHIAVHFPPSSRSATIHFHIANSSSEPVLTTQ